VVYENPSFFFFFFFFFFFYQLFFINFNLVYYFAQKAQKFGTRLK
jgi:hypothetical protein